MPVTVVVIGEFSPEDVEPCQCGAEPTLSVVRLESETHEPKFGVSYCSGCLDAFTQLEFSTERSAELFKLLANFSRTLKEDS
jgi:hypothetical protein